jgi:hypothetical protein
MSNLCAIKKQPITRHAFTDAWLLKKEGWMVGLSGTVSRVVYFKADHRYSRRYTVYFRTRARTWEERLDILSWNIKILSNRKLHCRNLQGKIPPLNIKYIARYEKRK